MTPDTIWKEKAFIFYFEQAAHPVGQDPKPLLKTIPQTFTILHKENGFCLSPAYDLLPDTEMRKEHDLMIGSSFLPPSREDLQELAKKWRIRHRILRVGPE